MYDYFDMSLEKFVEEIIQKAIENGEFDNLKGAGKPIDMDAYFNTPPEYRVGHSLLKGKQFRAGRSRDSSGNRCAERKNGSELKVMFYELPSCFSRRNNLAIGLSALAKQ
ncbi:MAG: DnaJ family domain-containing protein [Pyrinomonadaceae bacterium]